MIVKISKTQREILDLMKDGWELKEDFAVDHYCWIQKGRELKTVRIDTLISLFLKGYIAVYTSQFPISIYHLTGKEV